jgi:hypothetical protein
VRQRRELRHGGSDRRQHDATFTRGQVVLAEYTCTDHGSGVASCTGPVPSGMPVDTTSAGVQVFEVVGVDHVGNSTSVSASFTVVAPVPTIAGLIGQVAALDLPQRVERALTVTLRAADAAASRGRPPAARALLGAFVLEVHVLARRNLLTDAAAQDLIAQAQAIVNTL